MNNILELQELPSVEGSELEAPLISTLSVISPCPGWPSTWTFANC
ncbi:hypothetical protein [Spongiactinospora rosea]|nr:hypothetical protein [Spongiactinospora rosea]